jgi:hypothetical protein
MLIHHDPDEWTSKSEQHTCSYHRLHPGKPYAGCTCSGSWSSVRRAPEEVAAIKAERQRKDDDEILARAVKSAADKLEDAVRAAAANGLKTELRLLEYSSVGRSSVSPSHFVTVKVTKEL